MLQIWVTIEITAIAYFNSFHSPATMSFSHVTKKVSPRIGTETHEWTFSTSFAIQIWSDMNHFFQDPFIFLKLWPIFMKIMAKLILIYL